MADFYAARSGTIPPLPWTNFAPPLSQAIEEFKKTSPPQWQRLPPTRHKEND